MVYTSRKQHQRQQADRGPAERRSRRPPATAVSTSPHRRRRRAHSSTVDGLDGGHDGHGGGRTNHRNYTSISNNSDVSNVESGSTRSHGGGRDSCQSTRTSEGDSSYGSGGGGAFVGDRIGRGRGGGGGGHHLSGGGGDAECRSGVARGLGLVGGGDGGEQGCGDDQHRRGVCGGLGTSGDRGGGFHSPGGVRCSSPRELAVRLGQLEAKVAAGGGGEGGGGRGESPGRGGGDRGGMRTDGGEAAGNAGGVSNRYGALVGAGTGVGMKRVGDVSSIAENEVQSAALRHALLLEERGLQLERAEAALRKQDKEADLMRRDLRRLEQASVEDRNAWRRLERAEGEISTLLERSEELENLAKSCEAALEKECRARRGEKEKHASELERVSKEASAANEAAAREKAAADASRDLCEQMSSVCRQMREAAEEAGARCAEAENTAQALESRLALTEASARDAEGETSALRGKLEAAEMRAEKQAAQLRGELEACEREARRTSQELNSEKDAAAALRGFLRDGEARLERAEGEAEAARQACTRCEEISEGLRGALQRSQREAEQLRSRLEAAGDLAADEACRARGASEGERAARSQLASAVQREEQLRADNASLATKTEELLLTLENVTTELEASRKLSQDRLVDAEVSARAAVEAERRSQSFQRRADEERNAAESAQSSAVRAESARSEAERALGLFQGSMARALQGVEDSLVDALRGLGTEHSGAFVDEGHGVGPPRAIAEPPASLFPSLPATSAAAGGVAEEALRDGDRAVRCVSSREGSRGGTGDSGVGGRGGGGGGDRGERGSRPGAADADAGATMSRLGRTLSRIMRRIDDARGLRAWVSCTVEGARQTATEGLQELRGRWEAELDRLQAAERKVLRLQEQAKYGGRRAALDAREECYAKIERVEKDKWVLRDTLASEKREVEVLRGHLKRLEDASQKAAVSADHEYRAVCEELEGERGRRQRLQEKADLLEGKSSLLQGRLSALAEGVERSKAEELSQRQEKERLQRCQETLRSKLEREADTAESSRRELLERSEELSRGREKERELEAGIEAVQAKAKRLTKLLNDERSLRERERISGEQERAARSEEASRLTSLLEEERRARRVESALSEAVLREVRETQGLLGEMSPSGRGGPAKATAAFRGTVREHRSAVYGQKRSSISRGQALALDRIVSDVSRLVRQTGIFFDRYSETHRASFTAGKTIPADLSVDRSAPPGARRCERCAARAAGDATRPSSPSKPRAKVTFPGEGWDQRRSRGISVRTPNKSSSSSSSGGGSSSGKLGPAVGGGLTPVASVAATSKPSSWSGRDVSGSFLGRTMEQGSRAAPVSDASAVGAEGVRELDQRCYDLLEANAQLCVRVQGLGLEFAGLSRELLSPGTQGLRSSGSDHRAAPRKADERLEVKDLGEESERFSGERHRIFRYEHPGEERHASDRDDCSRRHSSRDRHHRHRHRAKTPGTHRGERGITTAWDGGGGDGLVTSSVERYAGRYLDRSPDRATPRNRQPCHSSLSGSGCERPHPVVESDEARGCHRRRGRRGEHRRERSAERHGRCSARRDDKGVRIPQPCVGNGGSTGSSCSSGSVEPSAGVFAKPSPGGLSADGVFFDEPEERLSEASSRGGGRDRFQQRRKEETDEEEEREGRGEVSQRLFEGHALFRDSRR